MKSINGESTENRTQVIGELNSEKKKPEAVKALYKLFVNDLKEIYWAEKEIKKCLNKIVKHASAFEIADELTSYHEVVNEHKILIEEVFLHIDEKAEDARCKFIEFLIDDTEDFLEETKKGVVRDAGIISYLLKIELYQIATYSAACFYARTLEDKNAADLLNTILDQKNKNFEKLSQIVDSIELERVDAGNQNINF
jgi:ferritin-like metal-binding protein YciE